MTKWSVDATIGTIKRPSIKKTERRRTAGASTRRNGSLTSGCQHIVTIDTEHYRSFDETLTLG